MLLPEETLLWVKPTIAFSLALTVALVGRRLVLGWISAGPRREGIGGMVARAFRVPTLLWALALSLSAGLRYVQLDAEVRHLVRDLIGAFIIVSLTLVAAAAAVRALKLYGLRQEKPFVAAGLSKTLTYVFVWSLGALWLLNYFDVDFKTITPFLTALGVGGLAVALALQDTMANFFAGIHILVEEPISLGDFIRLSTSEEGIVTDIGWRTTRVLTAQNTTIVIPNTKITSSILVNFNLPQRRVVVQTTIVVGHDADPDRVAAIALEEAQRTPLVLNEPAPQVFLDPGVLATHIQLRLDCSVAARQDLGPVQSALRLGILRRLRSEGIPLPDPRRQDVAGS